MLVLLRADLAGSAWLCSGVLYGGSKRRTRFSEFSISFENTGLEIISRNTVG